MLRHIEKKHKKKLKGKERKLLDPVKLKEHLDKIEKAINNENDFYVSLTNFGRINNWVCEISQVLATHYFDDDPDILEFAYELFKDGLYTLAHLILQGYGDIDQELDNVWGYVREYENDFKKIEGILNSYGKEGKITAIVGNPVELINDIISRVKEAIPKETKPVN